MSSFLRTLAVICARGGSKGLPAKNVKLLGGLPLVAWSVVAAKGAKLLSRIVLSTDDEEIAAAARAAGCEVPFMRPPELASDEAGIEQALFHALDSVKDTYDAVVLLQATSPFRLGLDIDACIEMLAASGAPGVVSVTKAPKPPYWMYSLDEAARMQPLLPGSLQAARRQDLPSAFVPNGAVYALRLPSFRQSGQFYTAETRAYVMPLERSIDIDTPLDFAYAQAILSSGLISFPQEQAS